MTLLPKITFPRPVARVLAALVAVGGLGLAWGTGTAEAQVAGTVNKQLPDVLLLVDTSGSMERMVNGSLPTACVPGTESAPNRWGMLVQSLTGSLQPYYSCFPFNRSSAGFQNQYKIGTNATYDRDYSLPYHRPISGNTSEACALAPYRLPGAATGSGVGLSALGAGGYATDFPDDAIVAVTHASNGTSGVVDPVANACTFQQGNDGQLDIARDFVRFSLMTFDNDPDPGIGVNSVAGLQGLNATVEFAPPATPAEAPCTVATPALLGPFSGTWSYHRHRVISSPFDFTASTHPMSYGGWAIGHPDVANCCSTPQEVGARNEGAPPWEGRLVRFPDPNATLFDLQRTNEQIQKVLLASRPYGATPIDAMLDDARDYYHFYDTPSRSTADRDPFVTCRDRYIVLLTDGAPNLDLRPSCTGGTLPSNGAGNVCPFPERGGQIAASLAQAVTGPKVTTFVIGFAVSGESGESGSGFPPDIVTAGHDNCKAWFEDNGASGGHNNPDTMQTYCQAHQPGGAAPIIAQGTTASACCALNEIAVQGTSGAGDTHTGAFFAESQADVSLAFGTILSKITRAATTRTTPVYTPPSTTATLGGAGAAYGEFVGSFIPNTQRPWSGELDRTRFVCPTGATSSAIPDPGGQTPADSTANNLATQSTNNARFFFSARADHTGGVGGPIDSGATIRPFMAGGADAITSPDGNPVYSATEVLMETGSFPTDWADALNITPTTCPKGRAILAGGGPQGTQIIPALTNRNQCMEAIWGFAGAYPGPRTFGTTYDFNVRCGGASTGKWSVTGTSCTLGQTPPIVGEVCVPSCSALGAIYHANPVVLGAPSAYSRDEGYSQFQTAWRTRQPIVLAATTDGLLHAFKAFGTPNDNSNELWAFAPPAVLPRLASNYPLGNQILLDGTPAIADVVWNRTAATATAGDWHTTLVAGLGSAGGGYYALNVTDADCRASGSTTGCYGASLTAPTQGVKAQVSIGGIVPVPGAEKPGPHFLWQLTDVPSTGVETARIARSSNVLSGGTAVKMRSLFGKHTSTPAIGTLQIGNAQVGVAILPGGYEDPPDPTDTCPRDGAAGTVSMADTTVPGNNATARVRKWASLCTNPTNISAPASAARAAVPGRGVTIVRLDTGEIIRHFGRAVDTPVAVQPKLRPTDFDSPMVGTPVVYPNSVGVPIQKIFIGDADGTLWRIDVSSVDPDNWRAALFQDLSSRVAGGSPLMRRPIQVAPVLSTDDVGNVVINVSTGDQDSIIHNTLARNYVFSITETRDQFTFLPKAQVNWFQELLNGELVTGPMTVFNRNLYFATYAPAVPGAAACTTAGAARLWGVDFVGTLSGTPTTPSVSRTDVLPRWCTTGLVDGVCPAASVAPNAPPGAPLNAADIIPGVTLQANASCATPDSAITDVLGSTGAFSTIQPVTYKLSFGSTNVNSGGPSSLPQAARGLVDVPTPRTTSKIDSWSIVIE